MWSFGPHRMPGEGWKVEDKRHDLGLIGPGFDRTWV